MHIGGHYGLRRVKMHDGRWRQTEKEEVGVRCETDNAEARRLIGVVSGWLDRVRTVGRVDRPCQLREAGRVRPDALRSRTRQAAQDNEERDREARHAERAAN